jgi:sugar phosphate isomerase/epimerase
MRVHPRLALNSLSTASWPLERDLELYQSLGVERAGLYFDKLESAGPEAAAAVAAAGVSPTQVFARGVTPYDPNRWAHERCRLGRAVEWARHLGAPCVSVTTGPAGGLGWDAAAEALGAALRPIIEEAGDVGIDLAVEQTLPVRVEVGFVHTFADTVELARRLGIKAVLEANYCFAERGLEDTVRDATDVLAIVQLSDLAPPCTVIPDRAVPGDGVVPLAHIVKLVSEAGYTGPFELEILGPRIEAEGYEDACRRGLAVLSAVFEEVRL